MNVIVSDLLSTLSAPGLFAMKVIEKDNYNFWNSVGFLWVMIPFILVLVLVVVLSYLEWRRRPRRRHQPKLKKNTEAEQS